MEEKKRIQMSVVDIERKYAYDPAEPIYGGEQLVSWGADNALPKVYAACVEKSATLGAAISQSENYVLGDGLEINADAWKNEVNRRGDTMQDLVNHIVDDYFVYGNYAIQVIFNKLGVPVELYALDVARCRLNGNKDKVFYSKKPWTKYQTKSEEFDRFGYADFNPEQPTQIYFYNGNGIRSVYNKSPWASAINDVLCEVENSEYALSVATNGFSCRYVLNIPDVGGNALTDEQKADIETAIKTKFTGPQANSFLIYFTNDEGKSIDVRKIESDDTPERYVAVRNAARENIFVSLRISPLLCGLGSNQTGFSTAEYSDSYKLYERSVASPIRSIIERSLSKITGIEDAVRIIPFSIKFETV